MKMLYKSMLMVLFGGAAMAVIAQTPTYLQQGPAPFEAYDRNGDGVITPEEFNTLRSERQAARAAAGMPMRNAASAPPFELFDSNRDGVLSPEEMAAMRQQRMGQHPCFRGPGYGPGMWNMPGMVPPGRGPGMGMGPGRGMNMPTFAEFDLNGDGVMTEDEFIEARGRRISERVKQGYMMRGLQNAQPFEMVDANGDGVVTEEEFLRMQMEHRKMRFQQ
jgi:Ca2+-binding EF-hand superfamily protein